MGIFSFLRKNNLLDTANNSPDGSFVPLNIKGDLELKPEEIIITNQILLNFFNSVAEISSVARFISDNTANLPYKLYKQQANGKKKAIESHELLTLFAKPNQYTQSFFELKRKAILHYLIFGNTYINTYKPLGSRITDLHLLSPLWVKIRTNNSDNDGEIMRNYDFRIENIIKYFYDSDKCKFLEAPENIIHLKDANINDIDNSILYGQSRLYAAISAISSLKAAYDLKVVAYQKRGAMTIISPESKTDYAGLSSLNDDEKKDLHDDFFKSYGVIGNRSPYIITNKAIKATSVPFDIQGLQIPEMSELDFRTLCKAFGGVPSRLLGDAKGSTYNNLKTDLRQLYENVLIPLDSIFWNAINNFKGFGLQEQGLFFDGYYDDIAALQDDELQKSTAYNNWNNYYMTLYNNGLITKNQWLEGLKEQPKTEQGFDELKTAEQNGIPNANE